MKVTMCVLLNCTLALVAFGAKKERDWQTGRVLDSTTNRAVYVTGAVTNTSGTATASTTGVANTTGNATTLGNITTTNAATTMSGTSTATENSTSSTAIQRAAVQTNELVVVAEKYVYVIEDKRTYAPGRPLMNAFANRKHGCRFVVGEDIKFAQDKGDFWVLDPDGKECKVPIIRQGVK